MQEMTMGDLMAGIPHDVTVLAPEVYAKLSDSAYTELRKLIPSLPQREHIIELAVTAANGCVCLQYSKPIECLSIAPAVARQIANDLMAKADEVEGKGVTT